MSDGFSDQDYRRDRAIDALTRRMDALEAEVAALTSALAESRDSPGEPSPDTGKAL